MDLSVDEAADRLGVSRVRVRQLLASGDLLGRRLGRAWLVDGDSVRRLEGHRRDPGRPVGPKRAWAILDLLSGGKAPWLSYSERSQVRSYIAGLEEPDADSWRGILRGRSEVRPVRAHPAALIRLERSDAVVPAGPAEAVQRGLDLVAGPMRPEYYVSLEEWPRLAQSLALRPSRDANVMFRHPMVVWPFDDRRRASEAVLAADLLNDVEPRAVRAGCERLNELLRRWAA